MIGAAMAAFRSRVGSAGGPSLDHRPSAGVPLAAALHAAGLET
jgi:hypothetical protein